MFQLRPAYTPPIFVSRRVVARVGGDVLAEAGIDPNAFATGMPLAFVGEETPAPVVKSTWSTQKFLTALYIAPFLAGPPLVGYALAGTIGAVGGAILAAPAIYLYFTALATGSMP